jgi:hypothetical protein
MIGKSAIRQLRAAGRAYIGHISDIWISNDVVQYAHRGKYSKYVSPLNDPSGNYFEFGFS